MNHIFFEPLAWMSSVEGKHNCPKCDAKICTLRWSDLNAHVGLGWHLAYKYHIVE